MRRILVAHFLLLSGIALADVPDVVITTLSSANSYATVAGRLVTKPESPVGVSVRNGNLVYSTLTDSEGLWGIVIRHISNQVSVSSWNLTNGAERGKEITLEIKAALP